MIIAFRKITLVSFCVVTFSLAHTSQANLRPEKSIIHDIYAPCGKNLDLLQKLLAESHVKSSQSCPWLQIICLDSSEGEYVISVSSTEYEPISARLISFGKAISEVNASDTPIVKTISLRNSTAYLLFSKIKIAILEAQFTPENTAEAPFFKYAYGDKEYFFITAESSFHRKHTADVLSANEINELVLQLKSEIEENGEIKKEE